MIALAGMIGTGLFLSSGRALSQAGPLGSVLGFIVVRVFHFQGTSIHWTTDGHSHCGHWSVQRHVLKIFRNDDCLQTAYASAEMSAFKPVGGGFVRHAGMWLDKSSCVTIG